MRYLGQHFLKNKNIVKKIADIAELNKSDVVLEVGPGKGILTKELLNRAGRIVAVEKDRKLCKILSDRFSKEIKEGKLVLIEGDILKSQISNLKSQNLGNFKNYKIVANIPYYITSRFLKIFLEEVEIQPQKMVLMVQKQVAERICETPPKSVLAVSVQVYSEPKVAFKVSAGNFSPPPEVDSAVLIIDNISKKWFNGIIEKDFFAVVKAGFAKKRKFLINNISEGLKIPKPEMEKVFKTCEVGFKARAEELELEEWKCLTKKLKVKSPKFKVARSQCFTKRSGQAVKNKM